MNQINSLIVDDERANRELLSSLIVQANDRFRIAGEAESVRTGFEQINALKPTAVFLDIRLGDGTAFDLLRKFAHIDFEVVFVSAFDEYALKAFDYNALDYLLKPINIRRLKETLQKVEHRITHDVDYFAPVMRAIQSYDPHATVITKIPIHVNDEVVLLELGEVMYVNSEERYTRFYKTATDKYLSSKQLSEFEFILSSLPYFIKISKGCFVNVNHIASYGKGIESYIVMKDKSVHIISRRKKTEILEKLGQHKKRGAY